MKDTRDEWSFVSGISCDSSTKFVRADPIFLASNPLAARSFFFFIYFYESVNRCRQRSTQIPLQFSRISVRILMTPAGRFGSGEQASVNVE